MRPASNLKSSLILAPLLVVGYLALSAAPALAVAPEAPTLTVQEPVHATTATFEGVLNPGTLAEPAQSGTYKFLYKAGATCTGGSVTKPSGLSFGASPEVLPAEMVTGLTPDTAYSVCLSVTNLEGETTLSAPVPFKTGISPEKPVTKSPAASITATTATLEGTLNPGGIATTKAGWYFAYSTEAKCTGPGEQQTGHEPELEGKAVPVTPTPVTGLQPHKTYRFCLVATDALGEATVGNEVSFTTAPLPPAIESESTLFPDTSTGATLEAQINPNNEKTQAFMQYSTSPAVEGDGALKTPTELIIVGPEIGEGYGPVPISRALSTLSAGTTYYYQAVAENAAGHAYGTVQSFTTVPTPTTGAVEAVAATFALFHGHLTPLNPGVATNYTFDYNLGPVCSGGNSTRTVEAGKGAGTEVAATEAANNLQPNAEYTVCFVTSNAFGSEHGSEVHFTTLAGPLNIASESVSGVSDTGATLEAQINPNNEKTSYAFEYATNAALTGATTIPGATELEGIGNKLASVTLTGLTTGETYYYRVVAENQTSKADGHPVDGETNHFTTLGAPHVTTGEAQHVTSLSAELAGTVNPAGLPTSYHFAYVEAAGYEPGAANPYASGTTTPESTVAPNEFVAHAIVDLAGGLKASTTYDYALIASNAQGGPVVGANQTFTTAATPEPPVAPAAPYSEATPPAATPPAAFPLLSHSSITELDAKEAKEDKGLPNPVITKTLTKAEKLAKALKACHKKKGSKRQECEKATRKKFSSAKKK